MPPLLRSKRFILTAAAIGLAVFLYLVLGGPKGVSGLYRLSADVRQLEAQVDSARGTIDSLREEILRLKTDTAYIERAAREKLGMARRDEKIYKFVEEK